MKQQSAISSRHSTTTANASRKATTPVRKLSSLLAISTVLMLSAAPGDTSAARYNDLGHRMMCTCNCQQVLLECNHGGRFSLTGSTCVTHDRMRGELRVALQNGDEDDMILRSFVQKYGATVLVSRSMKGLNKLGWIVAFAVLAATASIMFAFVRKWQSRTPIVTTQVADLQGIDVEALRRLREKTENGDF
jgi:cytochrome c-type biogenesis protein CcmH/NrfF